MCFIYTRHNVDVEKTPSTADDRCAFNMLMNSRLDMLCDYGCEVTSNVIESNADTNAAMDIRVEPNVDQRVGGRGGRSLRRGSISELITYAITHKLLRQSIVLGLRCI